MRLATLLGFRTSLAPVGWPPPVVGVSHGVGSFLLQVSCYPTLVFSLVPAQLPFRCFPFGVLRPCRGRQLVWLPFASLLLWLCWKGLCCATWFFSHVPCSSSGPAACAAFPDAGSLGVFRSLGVCPASLVTWVEFQPFLSFSMPLLLRLLAGVAGIVHPVWVLPLRWCLLGLGWGHPATLPLPSGGVLLACVFSGVRGSSRLWVRGRIFFPQAAAVGFSLCESTRLSSLLMGRCWSFTLASSSLAWLSGEPSTVFFLLCLPSGCGHPFGSLVSFVTFDRNRRWPLEWGFFFCVDDSRVCMGS